MVKTAKTMSIAAPRPRGDRATLTLAQPEPLASLLSPLPLRSDRTTSIDERRLILGTLRYGVSPTHFVSRLGISHDTFQGHDPGSNLILLAEK